MSRSMEVDLRLAQQAQLSFQRLRVMEPPQVNAPAKAKVSVESITSEQQQAVATVSLIFRKMYIGPIHVV